ncbi:MAG: 50S ribosomal protein L10 [Cyanobacteria bacterium J06638_20]
MGRTLENKKEIVAGLKQDLSEAQMAIVIDYKGLTVSEITDLRGRLRPVGGYCHVTKNTLMRIAVDGDDNWQPMVDFCKDSSAFLLLKEDIGSAIKAYQAFQKDTKKTEMKGGVMEGRALTEEDIKAIGDLPSKEELIAQAAGAINAVATKLAVGIKEVPSSLARALQAYADKDKEGDAPQEDAA